MLICFKTGSFVLNLCRQLAGMFSADHGDVHSPVLVLVQPGGDHGDAVSVHTQPTDHQLQNDSRTHADCCGDCRLYLLVPQHRDARQNWCSSRQVHSSCTYITLRTEANTGSRHAFNPSRCHSVPNRLRDYRSDLQMWKTCGCLGKYLWFWQTWGYSWTGRNAFNTFLKFNSENRI